MGSAAMASENYSTICGIAAAWEFTVICTHSGDDEVVLPSFLWN
jgi:hypothetical protein